MVHYSSSIYALWFLGTILHFLACWTVVRRGYYAHWKAFAYYLFCLTANTVVSIAAALFASPQVYRIVYDVSALIEALLLSLVVLEILVKTLEPFDSLPGREVARFGFWAVMGISLAVAVSVMVRGQTPLEYAIPLTVERTVFLAYAVLLWLLLYRARALGVSWQSSVAEIAIAFVLYLTVQATVRFVIAIYSQNDRVVDIANGFGQFAYLVSLASWIWTMTHRDPQLLPKTSEEALARIKELAAGDDAVPKERIFAAVGVKINRVAPEEVDSVDESLDPGREPARTLLN